MTLLGPEDSFWDLLASRTKLLNFLRCEDQMEEACQKENTKYPELVKEFMSNR